LLEVRDLAVAVDNRVAVEHADLHVDEGETVLLLGPNGSGKTSLLLAVAGHPRYRVIRGTIAFRGRDITHLTAVERIGMGIAVSFQTVPHVRGVKIGKLLEKIVCRHVGSQRECVEETKRIAKLLYIEHLLDREIGYGMSGGEMKRCEIAMVLAMRPKLALIDEPDSGVDVDSVLIIANALNELVRNGTAMVVVTHSGFIAKHLRSSRAYVMVNGRTVYSGSSDDVLRLVMEKGFSVFR